MNIIKPISIDRYIQNPKTESFVRGVLLREKIDHDARGKESFEYNRSLVSKIDKGLKEKYNKSLFNNFQEINITTYKGSVLITLYHNDSAIYCLNGTCAGTVKIFCFIISVCLGKISTDRIYSLDIEF